MAFEAVLRMGPAPFLTHYDASGRIELSGVTFGNWVAKTANLLDDLGADPDQPVSLGLAESAPSHWVTLVWTAAAWLTGSRVETGVPESAAFAVVGPEDRRRGATTVACSLHPFGRGFEVPPAGCVDYADVLAQPDAALVTGPGDGLAFESHALRSLTDVPPRSDRLLVHEPAWGWEWLRDALVAPALGGGSTVVVTGEADLDAIADAERVDTRA